MRMMTDCQKFLFLIGTLLIGAGNAVGADIDVSVPRDVWGGIITFVAQKGEAPKLLTLSTAQGRSEKYGVSFFPHAVSERVLEKNDSFILVTNIYRKSDVKMQPQGYPRLVLLEYSETITLYNKYGELLWEKQFNRPPNTPNSAGDNDFNIVVKLAKHSGVVFVADGGYGGDGELPNQFLTIDTTGAEICIQTWADLQLTYLDRIVFSESGKYVAISGYAGSNDLKLMAWGYDDCKVSKVTDDGTIFSISDDGIMRVSGVTSKKERTIDMRGSVGAN